MSEELLYYQRRDSILKNLRMFSAADFRFFAKICRNLYKHFAKCLQRMFFGSRLESIICKTKIRACACALRASPASVDSFPISRIYLLIINTVIGESGLCGWECQRKTAFDYLKSGHSVICLDGISECSNSF